MRMCQECKVKLASKRITSKPPTPDSPANQVTSSIQSFARFIIDRAQADLLALRSSEGG